MIGGLFQQATAILERRFLKNAFLPVLVFFPAVLSPSVIQDHRLRPLIRLWNAQSGTLKLAEAVGYFIFVWFVASIVASQWRNIIRLYEGYPLGRLPWLDRIGKAWHQQERSRLFNPPQNSATRFLRYWAYPIAQSDVLPTRLGNVLRAAETYSADRYRAESIYLWPRLYHALPREAQSDLEDTRATLEFLLVLSLWLVAFALGNILLAVTFNDSRSLAFGIFAGGLLGAYLAYISAIHAAVEYGAHIRATFEVYRFDLLTKLRISLPPSLIEERQRWAELYGLIADGTIPQWDYDPGASELHVALTDLQSSHDGSRT